jgi:hypothetical protein
VESICCLHDDDDDDDDALEKWRRDNEKMRV